MLTRSLQHLDLDAALRSVDEAAARAAHRHDVGLYRACGTALALTAEVQGADLGVARVNAALSAAGRSDVVPFSSSRTRAVLPAGVADALWLVLRANSTEGGRECA